MSCIEALERQCPRQPSPGRAGEGGPARLPCSCTPSCWLSYLPRAEPQNPSHPPSLHPFLKSTTLWALGNLKDHHFQEALILSFLVLHPLACLPPTIPSWNTVSESELRFPDMLLVPGGVPLVIVFFNTTKFYFNTIKSLILYIPCSFRRG